MKKLRVKYPVIVEGRYDKAKLSALMEGDIIQTDGFRIFSDKNKMGLIRRLAERGGVVILTDSDRAGFRIRGHIAGALPPEKVIHVYIPEILGKERRKAKPSAQGTLGVEGMEAEVLREALRKAGVLEGEEQPPRKAITKGDLYRLGFSGGEGSAALREALRQRLNLPRGIGANALPGILTRRVTPEELEAELPALKEIYKKERDAEVQRLREDSATDFLLAVIGIFNKVRNKVVARCLSFGLKKRLLNLALINRRMTTKEWEKVIRTSLGIDIRKDYYLGDFYIEQLKKWVSENVDLITSIPEDTLDKMKDIVLEGFNRGRRTTDIAKDIQLAYGVSRKKARFIARDQTAKLNGQIQRAQQMDAGIMEYIWSDCGDERVRRSHRRLNGQKFSWEGEGPETDNGRHCHPGQDFNCRCIGRPVFNRNTLNLPVKEDSGIKVTIK